MLAGSRSAKVFVVLPPTVMVFSVVVTSRSNRPCTVSYFQQVAQGIRGDEVVDRNDLEAQIEAPTVDQPPDSAENH